MAKEKATEDAGAREVQEIADKENSQGFRGAEVDITDNEAYTVRGVTEGQPTPETDAKQAAKVRDAQG